MIWLAAALAMLAGLLAGALLLIVRYVDDVIAAFGGRAGRHR